MGRPAKPTNLKLLHGDHKKNPQRINRAEPVPGAGVVEPTMRLGEEAREVWDRLAPDLSAKGVLTAWDADAFTTFCATVANYREASRQLAENGMLAVGSAGGVIKSPFWQIMRDAVGIMTSVGSRFGLTPSDRAKLVTGGGEKDPDADLLTG